MKKTRILIPIMLMLILVVMTGCGNTDQNQEATINDDTKNEHILEIPKGTLSDGDEILSLEGYGAKGALTDKDLTIADMLMYAVQDEYLAHGEYEEIIKKFNVGNPYKNILASEKNHLASLKQVYDAYSLTYPADSSKDHIIIPETLLDAAKTGVEAEKDNIMMYELFLTYELPESIKGVFQDLMEASYNHLSAFERQVDKLS